jgi:multiple sugar transport system substrate-binding protein
MTSQTLGITSFASDDQKAVAADFIKFLHSPEQLQAFYEATGVPPADDRFDVSTITSPALAQVYDWAYNPGRALVSNFLPNPPLNQNEPVLAVLSGQLDSAQAAADDLQGQAEQWRKANQLLVERYQTLLESQEALAG